MSFEVFIPSWKAFEALEQSVMDFGSFWEARINVQIVNAFRIIHDQKTCMVGSTNQTAK